MLSIKTCLGFVALILLNEIAESADVTVTIEAPGVQYSTAKFDYVGVEKFDSLSQGYYETFSSEFGLSESSITGTYKGFTISTENSYGGADGTGYYPVAWANKPYSLQLKKLGDKGVNYFGYWISALDAGNVLELYSEGKLISTFTATDVLRLVEGRTEYYGNPNKWFSNNSGEPYVFVNFFCKDCVFDEVRFTQKKDSTAGYETDNHTVGYFKATSGEVVTTLPPTQSPQTEANITVTIELPNVQKTTAVFDYLGVETFDSLSTGVHDDYESNFGMESGKIKGKYSGVTVTPADLFGGANGQGMYPVAWKSSPYHLKLHHSGEKGINYFGYWLSALDAGNQLRFYFEGRKIFEFTAEDVLRLIRERPEYLGNPNQDHSNSLEPYVFLNFFCNDCHIDEIHFSENNSVTAGYESDNHSVGYFRESSGEIVTPAPTFIPTQHTEAQTTEAPERTTTPRATEKTEPQNEKTTAAKSVPVALVTGAAVGGLAILGAAGGGYYMYSQGGSSSGFQGASFEGGGEESHTVEREVKANVDHFA